MFWVSSVERFVHQCPHHGAFSGSTKAQERNIILINAKQDLKHRSLVSKAFGKGVLDCEKTGEIWMNIFLLYLHKTLMMLRKKKSDTTFTFGDGGEWRSIKPQIIPVNIGGMKCSMKVEVVPTEMPILIIEGTMKGMGMGMSDIVSANGENIKFHVHCLDVTAFQLMYLDFRLKVVLHMVKMVLHAKKRQKKLWNSTNSLCNMLMLLNFQNY